MATGSFFFPATPTGMNVSGGAAVVSSGDVSVSLAGVTLNAVYYWKDVSDTGTHNITVYRTSDQSVVGTGTFSGETASGWQTFTFGTPLALPSGFSYRIAVSSPTSHAYNGSFVMPGNVLTGAAQGTTSFYLSGATTGYPSSSYGGFQDVDVLLGGLGSTQLRASQGLAETWVADTPAARVSQTLAEVWIQNQPPTDLRASQLLAETWVTDTGPPTQLRAAQTLAEVWVNTTVVGTPLQLSSQVI